VVASCPTIWGVTRSGKSGGRLTPQEKKALSYARDRRNTYGEPIKAARRNIPRRKKIVNRVNRRVDRGRLLLAAGQLDFDRAEVAEEQMAARSRASWQKSPDTPLGVVLQWRRERQARREAERS
jgi:hypothetical protein